MKYLLLILTLILSVNLFGLNNPVLISNGNPGNGGNLQFYYHSDHLGSSNYITDGGGNVYQHHEYFPFGETFVEERNNKDYTPYLFTGQELDAETGLYYFGARYQDPKTSVFYGVDVMMDKYPNIYNAPQYLYHALK